jgi:2-polyprenyl-3-methyl-5-hydroxy-6-metoxy-1,4-benzoquinol methylase
MATLYQGLTLTPYNATIELSNRNDAHTLVIEQVLAQVPARGRVLEVGCATGTLGEVLCHRGLHVTGVEPMAEPAKLAAQRLTEVFTGTVESFFDAHPEAHFDAIIFGDVLEHLPQPECLLLRAVQHLSPGGCVVASVPNATHASVRAMLLEGRWDTCSHGILDHTHLKFFSRRGLVNLFSQSQLVIEHLAATIQRVTSSNHAFGLGLRRSSMAWVELLCSDDSLEIYQYVVAAKKALHTSAAIEGNALWLSGQKLPATTPNACSRPRLQRCLRAAWVILRERLRRHV